MSVMNYLDYFSNVGKPTLHAISFHNVPGLAKRNHCAEHKHSTGLCFLAANGTSTFSSFYHGPYPIMLEIKIYFYHLMYKKDQLSAVRFPIWLSACSGTNFQHHADPQSFTLSFLRWFTNLNAIVFYCSSKCSCEGKEGSLYFQKYQSLFTNPGGNKKRKTHATKRSNSLAMGISRCVENMLNNAED